MLELINEKRSEYMMAESLYLDNSTLPDETAETLNDNVEPYPGKAPLPPSPHGVAHAKFQLYSDPLEFAHIDQIAISVIFQISATIIYHKTIPNNTVFFNKFFEYCKIQ